VTQVLEFVRIQQADAIAVRLLLDHGPRHAQVQPEALAPGDRMHVHGRMHDTGIGVDRGEARPELPAFLRKRIMSGALMGVPGPSAFLGGADDVVAGMGKGGRIEAAVVVPLRPHSGDAVTTVVRKAEDVLVATRRRRMDAVGAVQFPAAPPAARAEKVLGLRLLPVAEDEEPAMRHLLLERLQDLGRRLLAGQLDAVHPGTDRIERSDPSAEPLDDRDAFRIKGWHSG
jgi:hypothetical protein